jgi:hypothetical protein
MGEWANGRNGETAKGRLDGLTRRICYPDCFAHSALPQRLFGYLGLAAQAKVFSALRAFRRFALSPINGVVRAVVLDQLDG